MNQVPSEEDDAIWDQIANCIEAYDQACRQTASPPDFPDFLDLETTSAKRTALIELVKLRLQIDYEDNRHSRIEELVQSCHDILNPHDIPFDLVWEECNLRRRFADHPTKRELCERFPNLSGDLIESLTKPDVSGLPSGAETQQPNSDTHVVSTLQPGDAIEDFLLIRRLGRGSFAEVFLARQRSMGRLVALKVSKGENEEPATLAQFDHPSIVRVYDQRQTRSGHLMYMEYVPGGTLSDVIQQIREHEVDRSGQLILDAVDANLVLADQIIPEDSTNRKWLATATWSQIVCRYGAQLAEALDYAHNKGVLHCDIKPANVLLSAVGNPKLADFNVSRHEGKGSVDSRSSFGGTLLYMSPEHLEAVNPDQIESHESLDGRSDVFSLSLLLWEMWTRHRPWVPKTPADPSFREAWLSVKQSRTQPLPTVAAEGPTELLLRESLETCLQADRDKRIRSSGELARKLRIALDPDAARLVRPQESSLSHVASRFPFWIVVLLPVLLPNVIAALLNFLFNYLEIIRPYADQPGVLSTFRILVWVVNGIGFPIGIAIILRSLFQLKENIDRATSGKRLTDAETQSILHYGLLPALVGIFLWAAGGAVYAIALSLAAVDFRLIDAVQFFISLLICGLVAGAYPYLIATWQACFLFYPRLLEANSVGDSEKQFSKVRGLAGRFVIIAAGVPLLALALLVSKTELIRYALVASVAVGGMGLLFAFRVYQQINHAAEVFKRFELPDQNA